MFIDSRQNKFVTNMQLRQCFARAKPCRMKKSQKSQTKRMEIVNETYDHCYVISPLENVLDII